MTELVEPIGPERLIHERGLLPVSIVLASGNYVLAWEDTSGSPAVYQIYDSAGSPVGQARSMGHGVRAMAPLDSGGFVAVYANVYGAQAHIFNADGSPAGAPFRLGSVDYYSERDLDVVALASGGFAVSWRQQPTVTVGTYDSAGSPVATFSPVVGESGEAPQILELAGGTLALFWQEWDDMTPAPPLNPDGYQVAGRLFAPDGTALGEKFIVHQTHVAAHGQPQVTALADGGFVVTWRSFGAKSGEPESGINAQLFNSAGAPVGSNFAVSNGVPGYQSDFDVAALPSGGFLVTWVDYSPGDADPHSGIRAQLFDGAGARVGETFQVEGQRNASESSPSVLVLSDTEAVVFYRANPGSQANPLVGLLQRTIALPTFGTEGGDVLTGTEGIDRLAGMAGDDDISGGGANDALDGGAGDDALRGGAGDDTLRGGAGSDHLTGDDGNDILDGGLGADALFGGAGDDTYHVDSAGDEVYEAAGEGMDRVSASVSYMLRLESAVELIETSSLAGTSAINLTGSVHANTIYGNAGSNILNGGGGNDVLWGFGGDDYLVGGAGNDVLYGGTGNDTYYVDDAGDLVYEDDGGGQDRISASVTYVLRRESAVETIEASDRNSTSAINLTGSMFANTIFGNAGSNILYGEGGNDVLWGYGGDDFLVGGTGSDVMWGGLGNDTYYVDSTGDRIYELSGEGYDRVAAIISVTLPDNAEIELLEAVNLSSTDRMDLGGSDFANTISGNDGVNILRGNGGNDVLHGHGGDDFLDGGAGNDTMYGGTGNDTYYVDSSGDLVIELDNQGIDRIATSVSLELTGGSAVEVLEAVNFTGTQAMNLTGSDTANTITGNAAANVINGRGGSDILTGGGGADIFQFTTALGANNIDRIVDFQTGVDKIALDDAIFTGFNPGSLSPGQFVVGSEAKDGDDRIIYNPETGALMFDADGSGSGAAVQFAILQPGLSVTESDFMVI